MSIPRLLASIEEWLADNAPATHAMLAPPATHEEITAVERTLDVELLPAVWELLTWHNGAEEDFPTFDLTPGLSFIGAEATVAEAQFRAHGSSPDLPTWDRLWVPVATDGCGDHLVVDHGDNGRVMYALVEDGMACAQTWTDMEELLTETLDALRTGGELNGATRVVEDGRVHWM